jgi:Domain of unknown function (DUF4167)
MRNGQQQKRMRGRNRNRGHNPLTRVYESNGPDVKVRGTAHHIAEKYVQLARDAQSSGDPVTAEGYLQYAEHYFRLIAVAQAQFAQQNPNQPQQPYQRPDDEFDDGDDGDEAAPGNPNAQPYAGGAPVAQQHQPQQPQHRPQPPQPQPQPNFQGYPQQRGGEQNQAGLPAFITGGGGAPQGNGYDNEQGDRGGRYGRDRNNRSRNFRPQQGGNFDQRGGHQGDGQQPPAASPQSDQNSPPAEGGPAGQRDPNE